MRHLSLIIPNPVIRTLSSLFSARIWQKKLTLLQEGLIAEGKAVFSVLIILDSLSFKGEKKGKIDIDKIVAANAATQALSQRLLTLFSECGINNVFFEIAAGEADATVVARAAQIRDVASRRATSGPGAPPVVLVLAVDSDISAETDTFTFGPKGDSCKMVTTTDVFETARTVGVLKLALREASQRDDDAADVEMDNGHDGQMDIDDEPEESLYLPESASASGRASQEPPSASLKRKRRARDSEQAISSSAAPSTLNTSGPSKAGQVASSSGEFDSITMLDFE